MPNPTFKEVQNYTALNLAKSYVGIALKILLEDLPEYSEKAHPAVEKLMLAYSFILSDLRVLEQEHKDVEIKNERNEQP